MHMTQMIMEVDVPNKNGRIYPRVEIERVVEVWSGKQMFGQIDMPIGDPNPLTVDASRASHVVENLRIDDNNCLVGDVTVMKTPQGVVLDDLLTIDGLCFRSAGIGKATMDENGHVVITEYQMLSINAVMYGA